MLFLEEKPIGKEALKAGIRRQTIANKFVPVAGGSAFKNKGVQYLLDAVIDYLPGPLDIPPAEGLDPDNLENKLQAFSDDNANFCSLAFKLWSDPFVGKLVFFRVYSGKLTKGDTVYNPRTNKRERISRIIQIQADKREDIDTCYSGDIAAIVGIKNITTGDTLCKRGSRHPARAAVVPRSGYPRWRSNPRRRSTRRRWATRSSVSRKRIRHSAFSRMSTPARRSSLAWASCISRSSGTGCCANSRWTRIPASRRSRIAKRSRPMRLARESSSNSRAAAVSTGMSLSTSSRTSVGRD